MVNVISLVNFAAALVALIMLPSATARLSRLISYDAITLSLREKIRTKRGETSFWYRLIECHWCTGVWAALLTCPFAWTVIAALGVWPIWTCVTLGLLSIPAVAYEASRKIDREDA